MTGLALLLPIALTIFIVIFLLNLLTKPFQGTIESVLHHYDLLDQPIWFFSGQDILHFSSKILALITLFCVILLIGFLARIIFLKYLLNFGDDILHRIPMVNKIYKALQEVTRTVLSPNSTTFSHVVVAPFPAPNNYSIGLVTKKELPEGSDEEKKEWVSVFIPGTPNPTFGFMMMYRPDQLIYLDMTVEEAIKFVVSCGMIQNNKGHTGHDANNR